MIYEIIVQGIGFIGLALNVISFQSNKHKNLVVMKTGCELSFAVQYLLMGAYTGMVLDGISAIRNVIFIKLVKKGKSTTPYIIFFSAFETFKEMMDFMLNALEEPCLVNLPVNNNYIDLDEMAGEIGDGSIVWPVPKVLTVIESCSPRDIDFHFATHEVDFSCFDSVSGFILGHWGFRNCFHDPIPHGYGDFPHLVIDGHVLIYGLPNFENRLINDFMGDFYLNCFHFYSSIVKYFANFSLFSIITNLFSLYFLIVSSNNGNSKADGAYSTMLCFAL